jgi:hypothetical protein
MLVCSSLILYRKIFPAKQCQTTTPNWTTNQNLENAYMIRITHVTEKHQVDIPKKYNPIIFQNIINLFSNSTPTNKQTFGIVNAIYNYSIEFKFDREKSKIFFVTPHSIISMFPTNIEQSEYVFKQPTNYFDYLLLRHNDVLYPKIESHLREINCC